jgi:GTPase SAR1 family protein
MPSGAVARHRAQSTTANRPQQRKSPKKTQKVKKQKAKKISANAVKVALLGPERCGKSALVARLRRILAAAAAGGDDLLAPETDFVGALSRIDPTVEDQYVVDLGLIEFSGESALGSANAKKDARRELAILDTGGADVYEDRHRDWFAWGDVAVVVFSVGDRDSFLLARRMVQQIHESRTKNRRRRFASLRAGSKSDLSSGSGGKSFSIILCGTQRDLDDDDKRIISEEEGQAAARSLDCVDYLETSALDPVSVVSLFETARQCMRRGFTRSKSDWAARNDLLAKKERPPPRGDAVRAAAAAAAAAAANEQEMGTNEPSDGARSCEKCGLSVDPGAGMGYSGRIWHKGCFSCARCGKLFSGQIFETGSGMFHPEVRRSVLLVCHFLFFFVFLLQRQGCLLILR